MKKPILNVDIVKEKLNQMKGKNVKMRVNRGRKKIEIFSATLKDLYPSVFTVLANSNTLESNLQSYAYTEVVCGNVRICLEK